MAAQGTDSIVADAVKRDALGLAVAADARRRTLVDPRPAVANTKPLRWLMKLYPFKHLIILHAPPSLRELSAEAGQGMPNSL